MYESKIQDLFERKKSVKPPENGSFLFFENFQCSKIFFIGIFEDWLTKPEPIWNVSKYTFTVILEKFRNLSQIKEQRTVSILDATCSSAKNARSKSKLGDPVKSGQFDEEMGPSIFNLFLTSVVG